MKPLSLFQKKPLCIANWKQYLTLSESVRLYARFQTLGTRYFSSCTIAVAPSAISLAMLSSKSSSVLLGAQQGGIAQAGAYTVEISPRDTRTSGGSFVIVGHSERRQIFGETDVLLRQRLEATYEAGLVPVYCVGESRDIYTKGFRAVKKHLTTQLSLLKGLNGFQKGIVIAYEPVWSIGSGTTPTFAEALAIYRSIREILDGLGILDTKTRILYGGSVQKDNAAGFLHEGGFSGLLIGGASTRFADFRDIIHSLEHIV